MAISVGHWYPSTGRIDQQHRLPETTTPHHYRNYKQHDDLQLSEGPRSPQDRQYQLQDTRSIQRHYRRTCRSRHCQKDVCGGVGLGLRCLLQLNHQHDPHLHQVQLMPSHHARETKGSR